MPAFTPEVYTSMGLNDSEYKLITELLQRDPTYTELGMFAVMWSEHCGYKYSRPILSRFKKYKEAIEGSGLENAGVVPIGDGLGVTMKVESHNHPSYVEPYQGAATGVGGIIRDILTMGARPVAMLNSLRFGPLEHGSAPVEVVKKNRYLFAHVVEGIAGYGNCVGVPTVAGEVNFHPNYSGNPLVNAMCVGVLKMDEVTTAAASGIGNPVLYLGSSTGRDGIHGATFASETFGEDSDAKRPNVQIGDPFAEKQLIEATLEALQTGAVVAIQDMGAAGLTCSTVEMSSQGGVGMTVDLDLVPMRESDMSGYELMLSESQERMLAVTHLGREQEVIDVFHKWGIHAVVVGHVTDNGLVTVTRQGEVIANLDPTLLTDHCPVYHSEQSVPEYFRQAEKFDPTELPATDTHEDLLKLLASPDIASKRYVFRQYDQQVQTQTVNKAGVADAATIAPSGSQKAFSVKIDGNARWTRLHPRRGGQLAVVEAARNVACTGAKPVAVTDGLNFGSPQQPHVYWQFAEAVEGIAEASEALETPVISGNVSFYNESELGEIPPTPMIGMLGILDSADDAIGMGPKCGESLVLLTTKNDLSVQQGIGASSYLQVVHGIEDGQPEAPNLNGEKDLCTLLYELAKQKLVSSAHDISDGGLGVALAEMAMASRNGIHASIGSVFETFAEIPGMVVVGTSEPDKVKAIADRFLISARALGSVTEQPELNLDIAGKTQKWSLSELTAAFEGTFDVLLN
ncbi:MAG: phosphoribosylformylglycinamidine synthase subunit PurL [Armatimonadetes bacterium]|nr:phosphoribosylformylglycinamidine synthase subunit PurL [Armatimonadota bacterium]